MAWLKYKSMQAAVILAGGEGTRLRPLTYHTPKSMVPILNKPLLEHMINHLKRHSIEEVIIALNYLPQPIYEYFGDGSEYGVRIIYTIEEPPLGTAGAVKNAEALLSGPFIVLNGDILTEIDLSSMIKKHKEVKPKVSIALTPVDNPTIYGVVETDPKGMVRRFLEKPSRDEITTNMINAGIYILEPEVLEYIPSLTPLMFEHHLFPFLLERGEPVLSYPSNAYWLDIGTPEKYLKANHDMLLKMGEEVRIERGAKISPQANIKGPVLIGEGCFIGRAQIKGPAVLGPRCRVGDGVVIEGAVLWSDVRVDRGAILRNCIIASKSQIQENRYVPDGCVLGRGSVVGRKGIKLAQDTHLGGI